MSRETSVFHFGKSFFVVVGGGFMKLFPYGDSFFFSLHVLERRGRERRHTFLDTLFSSILRRVGRGGDKTSP